MTRAEQAFIAGEIRRAVSDERERILTEVRMEMHGLYQKIHNALSGLGIISQEEKYLTRDEVMAFFKVGKSKLAEMMADGRIPYIKKGTAKQARVLFRAIDVIEAFDAENRN